MREGGSFSLQLQATETNGSGRNMKEATIGCLGYSPKPTSATHSHLSLCSTKNRYCTRNSRARSGKICAVFWKPKKRLEPQLFDRSLGSFTISRTPLQGGSENCVEEPFKISFSISQSISKIDAAEWDACAIDATGSDKFNPFISHGFLSSLEETGCAVKETGWLPQHIIARDQHNNILGVAPLYLKSHSNGEYVFDHSWANAYYRYGVDYYPKLQCSVPFTPVTGERVLVRNNWCKDQIFSKFLTVMKFLADELQVSSLHVTFPSEKEWHELSEDGFLQRMGMQYHWKNRNYKRVPDGHETEQKKKHTTRTEEGFVSEFKIETISRS